MELDEVRVRRTLREAWSSCSSSKWTPQNPALGQCSPTALATALKISPKQIRRLERRGAFPIPRLPKLDRHPRYARAMVERFTLGQLPPLMTRRQRAA